MSKGMSTLMNRSRDTRANYYNAVCSGLHAWARDASQCEQPILPEYGSSTGIIRRSIKRYGQAACFDDEIRLQRCDRAFASTLSRRRLIHIYINDQTCGLLVF